MKGINMNANAIGARTEPMSSLKKKPQNMIVRAPNAMSLELVTAV
jgi:hypothetical protein